METVRFSDGNTAVRNRLQAMATPDYAKSVYGGSAIRDAIENAARLFDQPTSADAIYLVTDGYDNLSKSDPGKLGHLLASSSVRLFVTIVSSWDNAGPRPEVSAFDGLSTLAEDSGGYMLGQISWVGGKPKLDVRSDAATNVSLSDSFSRYFRAITEDQALQIKLSAPINKPERLKLKLSDSARKRWKGAQVIYPNFLAGCSGG